MTFDQLKKSLLALPIEDKHVPIVEMLLQLPHNVYIGVMTAVLDSTISLDDFLYVFKEIELSIRAYNSNFLNQVPIAVSLSDNIYKKLNGEFIESVRLTNIIDKPTLQVLIAQKYNDSHPTAKITIDDQNLHENIHVDVVDLVFSYNLENITLTDSDIKYAVENDLSLLQIKKLKQTSYVHGVM